MASPTPIKSWIYTSGGYPSSLTLSTTTPPSSPAPNHLLIQIHACALNPVDIQIMNLPIWSLPILSLSAPKTPCSDFSGTVIAAGEGITDFKPGDAVCGVTMKPFTACGGTLSEIAHLNLANTTVMKKPEGWTHAQAAAVPLVWLTARTCIEFCEPYVTPTTTKRVVVLGGSSSSGIYNIVLAKRQGWKVLTSCSGRNAEFVQSETVGADEVVDYTKESVPERVKAFQPDAIIDCVGGTECIGIAKRYVTIVGDKTSRTTMGGSLLYFVSPRMVLRWAWGRYGWGRERYDCIVLEQKKEYLEEAVELLGSKGEGIVVDSTWKFEDAAKAYERLNTGRARGKVVVEVR